MDPHEVSAEDVGHVGLFVGGPATGVATPVRRVQVRRDRAEDVPGRPARKGRDFSPRGLVPLGPHVAVRGAVDQLDVDQPSLAHARNRSLHDRIHLEAARDLREPDPRALELGGRGPRRHLEQAGADELGGQGVGDGLHQPVLSGVPGEVFQGQDRDRADLLRVRGLPQPVAPSTDVEKEEGACRNHEEDRSKEQRCPASGLRHRAGAGSLRHRVSSRRRPSRRRSAPPERAPRSAPAPPRRARRAR